MTDHNSDPRTTATTESTGPNITAPPRTFTRRTLLTGAGAGLAAGALAGLDVYAARMSAIVAAMTGEADVRLPGARRFALRRRAIPLPLGRHHHCAQVFATRGGQMRRAREAVGGHSCGLHVVHRDAVIDQRVFDLRPGRRPRPGRPTGSHGQPPAAAA